MRAVRISGITPGRNVGITDAPTPVARPGWVLVRVKAFGLNHSEQVLRLAEIENGYIARPVIPGIECAGIVEDPSDSGLVRGQTVVALMGGMGRSFDGSYAEFALLPIRNVFPVETNLSWTELGAVPETYYTAWGSLFQGLGLRKGETLLVRGATCALGYAAVQIASAYGCRVVATTHRESKLHLLADADEAVLDGGTCEGMIADADKALECIGPRTIPDTLRCVRRGGIVCSTGILGDQFVLNNFDPIRDIPNGVYLTGFFSNYPEQKDISDVFSFLDEHSLVPRIGRVFRFKDVSKACTMQDEGGADGKIVVVMDDRGAGSPPARGPSVVDVPDGASDIDEMVRYPLGIGGEG